MDVMSIIKELKDLYSLMALLKAGISSDTHQQEST